MIFNIDNTFSKLPKIKITKSKNESGRQHTITLFTEGR